LNHLDSFTLSLSAAFDVSARVGHITHGISGPERYAGWRRQKWLQRLPTDSAALLLVADNSVGFHTLAILSALRNTIHERALDRIGMRSGPIGNQELVQLPAPLYGRLVSAVHALDGPAAWGIQPLGGGLLQAAHPDVIVEQLLPRALGLLDDLLAATPTGDLPGVDTIAIATAEAASRAGYGQAWVPASVNWQVSVGHVGDI
jgi:hypothetical protein